MLHPRDCHHLSPFSCAPAATTAPAAWRRRRAFRPSSVPGMAAAGAAALSCAYGQLAAGLQQLAGAQGTARLVLFTADPDPATGALSWCPDCVRAVPVVRRIAAERGVPLLEVLVGARAVWKDAAHPLRHDPAWRLSGVPTLVRYDAAMGPGARLGPELEAATTEAEVEALVGGLLAS